MTAATARPATDPTNLAGLVTVPRHRAPVVSKAARDAEVSAMNGEHGDHLGRHVAETGGAA